MNCVGLHWCPSFFFLQNAMLLPAHSFSLWKPMSTNANLQSPSNAKACHPILRRLFYDDHLLPDLIPLSSLGIVDGSPITLALASERMGLGRHVKVVVGPLAALVSCCWPSFKAPIPYTIHMHALYLMPYAFQPFNIRILVRKRK